MTQDQMETRRRRAIEYISRKEQEKGERKQKFLDISLGVMIVFLIGWIIYLNFTP